MGELFLVIVIISIGIGAAIGLKKKDDKEREVYENKLVAAMSFVYRQVKRDKLIFTEDNGLFYVSIDEQRWMFYDKLDAAMFVCNYF